MVRRLSIKKMHQPIGRAVSFSVRLVCCYRPFSLTNKPVSPTNVKVKMRYVLFLMWTNCAVDVHTTCVPGTWRWTRQIYFISLHQLWRENRNLWKYASNGCDCQGDRIVSWSDINCIIHSKWSTFTLYACSTANCVSFLISNPACTIKSSLN